MILEETLKSREKLCTAVDAVIGAVKKMSVCFGLVHSPPCITARRGGRAINKCCKASDGCEAGVVFRLRTKRKTTQPASVSVASRNFINDAATPPCGDARRGMLPIPRISIFFHSCIDGCCPKTNLHPPAPVFSDLRKIVPLLRLRRHRGKTTGPCRRCR